MGTRKILLVSALLFSSIVNAETVVPGSYMVAGKIGDTWVYDMLDRTQFTWTFSQVASGPSTGRFEKGNIGSGLIHDVSGNILSLYEIEMIPLGPRWDIGEIELGQPVANGDPGDPSLYLFWKVPSIAVQGGSFNDVLTRVWLDNGFGPNAVNTQLGLDPSNTAAVSDVNYYVPEIGEIKYQGVDALTGNSDGLG